LLDVMLSGAIDSPIMKIPKTTIAVKKDFTEDRKQVKLNARMEEPVSKHVTYRYLLIICPKSNNHLLLIL